MYLLIIIILVIGIIYLEKIIDKKQSENIVTNNNLNYKKSDYLFTKTELKFYRELIKITDELNLVTFPKIDLQIYLNIMNIKILIKLNQNT